MIISQEPAATEYHSPAAAGRLPTSRSSAVRTLAFYRTFAPQISDPGHLSSPAGKLFADICPLLVGSNVTKLGFGFMVSV